MGHRKKHAPKRGSLAYLPRGRAKRAVGRIRFWPKVDFEAPTLLGFAGYKAGMTYAYMIDNNPLSPYYGKEVFTSVTVVEAPPIIICGIRAYKRTNTGLQTLTEAWIKEPPRDLARVFTIPKNFKLEKGLKRMEEALDQIEEFRVVASMQPRLANISRKKPEVMEIKIDGGSIKDQFEFAKRVLGGNVHVSDVFKEGQYVDVVAVSKGKGFQGPVKRWGIKKLSHKSRKTVRGVGCIGPWHPAYVTRTVPRAGQMGYHQRTEYNKRILGIGKDGSKITPKDGFIRYGVVRSDYILLSGSVPGPAKRLIRLRYPARAPSGLPKESPRITYVSLEP